MAIKGPRDVRRDPELRALLEHAPAEATTMWFKRSELCSWEAHPAAALVETNECPSLRRGCRAGCLGIFR